MIMKAKTPPTAIPMIVPLLNPFRALQGADETVDGGGGGGSWIIVFVYAKWEV